MAEGLDFLKKVVTLSCMNMTSHPVINGKKLTATQLKFLSKLELTYSVNVSPFRTTARNMMNGLTINVHPVIAAVIEFIQVCYRSYTVLSDGSMVFNGVKVPIATFDRARMLVLNIDPETYQKILD